METTPITMYELVTSLNILPLFSPVLNNNRVVKKLKKNYETLDSEWMINSKWRVKT